MSESEERSDVARSGPGGTLAHRVPDLGALELLLAVARLGSLGAAAREVGVTQPAASSRIRSMERQLGVALVDRSPRGSRLTDAGALVTDWARRIVAAAEAFDVGAQALRDRRGSRGRGGARVARAGCPAPGRLSRRAGGRAGSAGVAGGREAVACAGVVFCGGGGVGGVWERGSGGRGGAGGEGGGGRGGGAGRGGPRGVGAGVGRMGPRQRGRAGRRPGGAGARSGAGSRG